MQTLRKDSLWTDYDKMSLAGLPIGRRVTVARGASGQLVVFSPVRASSSSIAQLEQLGEIAAFVLPNRVHDLFYDGYFDRFPRARFIAGRASMVDHPSWRLSEISPDLPELAGFRYLVLAGMPRVQEHVFLHEASRTLLLADSLFNLPRAQAYLTRLWMRMASMGGKPRPSRLFRFMIQSRSLFISSLKEVLTWDFDRIIAGHGEIIETDGKKVFEDAFLDFLTPSSQAPEPTISSTGAGRI